MAAAAAPEYHALSILGRARRAWRADGENIRTQPNKTKSGQLSIIVNFCTMKRRLPTAASGMAEFP